MNTHTDRQTTDVTDSRQALERAVGAFIAGTRMTRTRFGAAALKNPGFAGRLARGSAVRLSTADRVLAFMGGEPIGPRFRREVEAYIGVTRTKPYLLGQEAVNDPSFVARLRGGSSTTLATVDRVRAWMAAHASAAEREAVRASVEEGADAVPVERRK